MLLLHGHGVPNKLGPRTVIGDCNWGVECGFMERLDEFSTGTSATTQPTGRQA